MSERITPRANHRAKLQSLAKEKNQRLWKMIRKIAFVLLLLTVATVLTVSLWPDPTKATLETVAETDSQDYLFEIATRGPSPDIRTAAMEKLTDQSLLAEVAMRYSHGTATQAALRVHQPELLEKIAIHGRDHWATYVAALKIRDQAALERIALASQHKVSAAYEFAVLSLVDLDIVRRVAKQARDRRVRAAALQRLEDSQRIPEKKRIHPISKITDRDELFRMASQLPYSADSLPINRGSAAHRIAELNREEAIQKRAEQPN